MKFKIHSLKTNKTTVLKKRERKHILFDKKYKVACENGETSISL